MDFNLWNFSIAVCALIVAIVSILYTFYTNQRSVKLTGFDVAQHQERPDLFEFDICNDSNRSFQILNIELLDEKQTPIRILDFEPMTRLRYETPTGVKYKYSPININSWEYASPVDLPHVLCVSEKINTSYYIEGHHQTVFVKISCDKKIHRFKKHQLFSAHFDNNYQGNDVDN